MSHSHLNAASSSNFQPIINNALKAYKKRTKKDILVHPLASQLEACNNPAAILAVLYQQVQGLDQSQNSDDRWTKWLGPTINVICTLSDTLGEGVGLAFSPAKAIFIGVGVLLSTVKDVRRSQDTLVDVFERIESFIRRLEIYTEMRPTTEMMDTIVQIMVEILSILGIATKEIKEGVIKKYGKKLIGRTDLEDGLKRLDKLTQEEARMATAEVLRTTHGIDERVTGVGERVLVIDDRVAGVDNRVAGVDNRVAGVDSRLAGVDDRLDQVKRDQLRWDVQHWLSPPDPSTNHDFVRKARHSGTAAWFFQSNALAEWKARGSLLWIHGKPGAGKSTLLSAVIQDVEGMHAAGLATMAYYYFDFRDVKKQDCYGLLSSLILQLSAESDSCYDILSQLYSDSARGVRKPTISALQKCMTDILSLPGQAPTYIIIDGLDECPNLSGTPSAREEVLELIKELVDSKLPNVHLCAASRPEMDIRMVLEPLTSLKISLHDEIGQKEDIIEYIKSVVRSDRSMRRWKEEDKQLVIHTLSDKADGMFRWVVCQVERLRRTFPASIRSVLNDLPKTLDETYSRTLLGIDEEKREYAQRLFRCLTVSIRPLRVDELAEILAIRFDNRELPTFNAAWRPESAEEAVISACSSFITIVNRGGSRVVQFAHFSAKEFLTSDRLATAEERLSYYHILPEPAHTILAHASLSVLLQLDDKIDKDAIDQFPLAPYAARYWVNHAQVRNVSSHIREVMEHLFDSAKPHFAAWVWLHDLDRYWTEPMSTMHPTRPEAVPLYYAALCGFCGLVEHLIAADPEDVNSEGGSHTTPLHAASVKGYFDVALQLLKNGADPNSRDVLDRAPLHRVSQGGQLVMEESSLEIARLLVNSGANVNVTDNKGGTPLHTAAQSGYRDIAELLLESGAILDVRNGNQETPLHVASTNGKLDISRFLIDRGSDMNSRDKNGYFPLHSASRFGHIDIARLLLDRGSDVEARNNIFWTPLIQASRFGYLDLARLLMDRGADPNAYDEIRWTGMHYASVFGHLDIAKLLVERGAHVDSQNNEGTRLDRSVMYGYPDFVRFLTESGAAVSIQDNKGWTPFHTASYFGHLQVTKFLLEFGIDVDIRNGMEQTPLYLASSSGKLDVVHFLIEHRADIHAIDIHGRNPLHIASQNGHLDVVRMLINTGIAVDIRNWAQETSLALASTKGKVEVGLFLIERGADTNARDNQRRAPLHFASEHEHFDMARLLLDHGVDANIQRDDLWSPLHQSSANGHLKIAELLVQRGASVDILNDKQETPLYQAVMNGKVAISHLLIGYGANLHSADGNGWTVLHAASQRGSLGIVKLLLRCGADVDVLNKANKTAAELASENGKAEIAKFITEYKADANVRNKIHSTTLDTAEYFTDEDGKDEGKVSLRAAAEGGNIDVVRSLLEQGVNVNCRNAINETPLDRAAAKGKVDVVRLLIERGAEVDSRDDQGWTPLHEASRFGHLEVAQVLVDHGANVNARQLNHWTPLDLSACNGYLGIVKLLLERGADVHVLNAEGETPYQVALQRGHRDIADLLREHGASGENS